MKDRELTDADRVVLGLYERAVESIEWDESDEAEQWARVCGTRHHDVPVTGSEMLDLIPEFLGSQAFTS